MDNLTKAQRRKAMQQVHSSDTLPEKKLRKALWRRGIRYRKNYKGLPGTPDIVIMKYRIIIFVDGDFWHGNPLYRHKSVRTHIAFWNQKIKRNIARDKAVNEQLTEMGWLVIRIWESDIKKNFSYCIDKILQEIPQKNSSL